MTVVIDSIVVNGSKVDSGFDSDIELRRNGAAASETDVRVGTELFKGDWIRTKENDQVVLRVRYGEEESNDLVFLDPNSHVTIGSVCAVAGRILAWVSSRFRLCTSWGTLGVSGTEFEVNVEEGKELTVLVYEGAVSLEGSKISIESPTPTPEVITSDPAAKPTATPNPRVLIGEAYSAVRETIPTGKKLKIEADGRAQSSDFLPAERATGIDRWSDQIIKTNQKAAAVTKGYVNYSDDQRPAVFKQARRAALLGNSGTGYLDMAQALNDWDNGAAAAKSLSKVKDSPVRDSAEFMVNAAEAQRLQGNLSKATTEIEKTLKKHPEYAPAYYVSAKVSETKALSDPVNKVNDLEAAKSSFNKALANDQGTSRINKQVVEADLEKTQFTLGKDAQLKPLWLTYGHRWFTRDTAQWVHYSGTTSLKVGGTQVSGDGVLSIFGDQFKLKTAEKIFTGRITGNPRARGISFAMTFDNPDPRNKSWEKTVISVIGTKLANGIVLQSLPNQSMSFYFKTQPRNRFR